MKTQKISPAAGVAPAPKAARLTGALNLTAHSFANIARPGDVFSFEGKRHTVESVGLLPVVIRTTERVTLKPDPDALISWEKVSP